MSDDFIHHLEISDRNLAIARRLLTLNDAEFEQPLFEWSIIVSFYAAVRSINAYLLRHEGSLPRTHGQRARKMQQSNVLQTVLEQYTQLENWSRDARYSSSPSAFDEHSAAAALTLADFVRQRIMDELREHLREGN